MIGFPVFKSLSRDLLGVCSSGGERGIMPSTLVVGPGPLPSGSAVMASPRLTGGGRRAQKAEPKRKLVGGGVVSLWLGPQGTAASRPSTRTSTEVALLSLVWLLH